MINKIWKVDARLIVGCGLLILIFQTVGCASFCSAAETLQSEEQMLQNLRQMSRDGKTPPESYIVQIENTFPNTKTAALAKLLRAKIRFDAGDYASAADLLNSKLFEQKTELADYALWLRGKALLQAGRFAEAQQTFEKLVKEQPTSLRRREAKLLESAALMQNGQSGKIPALLADLTEENDAEALLAAAKSYEQTGDQGNSLKFYRRVYFYGAGTEAAKEAQTKLIALNQNLAPETADEIKARAERLSSSGNYGEAQKAFDLLASSFPSALTSAVNLKRATNAANLKNPTAAQTAFLAIAPTAKEKPEAYYQLARAYALAKQWSAARTLVAEMQRSFPTDPLTPKTVVAVGMIARDQKNKIEETYFLRPAVASYPNAVEVATAQFELAWLEHEAKNFAVSSQMLTEHLARYTDKDTTYRGRAGYWAARDSERAGKTAEACALYEAVNYRYSANWYGYLGQQRLASLKALNQCSSASNFAADSLVGKAVANLKTVTVASETAGQNEERNVIKAEQLSLVGLFDWAVDELKAAGKTSPDSPKVNLAVAKIYRLRGDNVNALLALARSYPDYSQMFPEEMGREEWDVFYPLEHWQQIKLWAQNRNLDKYQVAGLIRQESVFNPRAKSGANAYGLMQLLVPTAQAMARKYGSAATVSAETLFQPALNIELGTAYMRDQFDKFGRLEYVAAAYNAGPGRIAPWRASLPIEIDEFVEAIPFRETRLYVQGVTRNAAQYRRLYDDNGKFKSNVGTKPIRPMIDGTTRPRIAEELPEVIIKNSNAAEE